MKRSQGDSPNFMLEKAADLADDLPDNTPRRVDTLCSHTAVGLASIEREPSKLLLYCFGKVGVIHNTVEWDLGCKYLVEVAAEDKRYEVRCDVVRQGITSYIPCVNRTRLGFIKEVCQKHGEELRSHRKTHNARFERRLDLLRSQQPPI